MSTNAKCLANEETQAKRLNQAGFTLIELMVVVAVIGLIAGLVGVNVMKRLDESRVSATKIQVKQLGTILADYRRVCNRYPTTEEGLDALVHPPATCKNADPEGFLTTKKLPKDAWDGDFVYVSDGNKFNITSLGADHAEGGEGVNKDISSDDLD